ncbi:MAG: hypothetical protein O3A00_20765 [Planctomycetota bacterium]|nr:hypothetical protein [Planctomycetota bacterium]
MATGKQLVVEAIEKYHSASLNFAYEAITNAAVREAYLREIQAMSDSMLKAYESGQYTAEEAANLANQFRNQILDASRARQTTLGKSVSEALKKQGKAVEELLNKYALDRFKKTFDSLDDAAKEEVFVEVIKAAGRDRKMATTLASRLKWGGRALVVLNIGIALYNIGSSESKAWSTGHELAKAGGGIGGGAAGGAIAGIWFGPVGIAVGAAVGGILGVVVADQTYIGMAGAERQQARDIVNKYAGVFGTDEDAIAKALIDRSGINMDEVHVVFLELDENYNSDADDVAYLYVNLVKQKGGSLLQALKLNTQLRNLLIRILDDGWTTGEEYKMIDYLKQL